MAKLPKKALTTKKHLARIEREKIQTRYMLIGGLAVILAVIALIVYGYLDESYFKKKRPVAIVNGEKISTEDFQAITRYNRERLVENGLNSYSLINYFANDPQTLNYIASQLYQIDEQLKTEVIGKHTLDQLIEAVIMRHEAEKRGITVTDEEIQIAIEEAFNFYSYGTPTPAPTSAPRLTSTLSPTQYALISPTPTDSLSGEPTSTPTSEETDSATELVTPTITPTSMPSPTPTAYTREGFNQAYQQTLSSYQESIAFSEENLRMLVRMQLYLDKLRDAIVSDIDLPDYQEQVWARHILVSDEQIAIDLLGKIRNGEDWNTLAAELSIDASNKNQGGDLGWFGRNRMVPEFEAAAFALNIGEISEPVQTNFGWHIIQLIGKESVPVSEADLLQLKEQEFSAWLEQIKETTEITINDNWINLVPTEPTLPAEVLSFLNQMLNQQFQPVVPTPAQ